MQFFVLKNILHSDTITFKMSAHQNSREYFDKKHPFVCFVTSNRYGLDRGTDLYGTILILTNYERTTSRTST